MMSTIRSRDLPPTYSRAAGFSHRELLDCGDLDGKGFVSCCESGTVKFERFAQAKACGSGFRTRPDVRRESLWLGALLGLMLYD